MIGDENILANFLSEEALLEQLLEECGELVQAASKRLRILRGENWTPCSADANSDNVREELSDVGLCIDVYRVKAGIDPTEFYSMKESKCARWIHRLGIDS